MIEFSQRAALFRSAGRGVEFASMGARRRGASTMANDVTMPAYATAMGGKHWAPGNR
jgi:hypothetical protein